MHTAPPNSPHRFPPPAPGPGPLRPPPPAQPASGPTTGSLSISYLIHRYFPVAPRPPPASVPVPVPSKTFALARTAKWVQFKLRLDFAPPQ